MNTKKHMKIAGALQMVQGASSLLFGAYYAFSLILGIRAGSETFDDLSGTIVMSVVIAVSILWGAVQTWFGVALIRQRQWTSQVIGLILCALTCLSFPHIMGIYTLVVLVQVNSMKSITTEPTIAA